MEEKTIKPLILILSDQAFLRRQPVDILKKRIEDEGFSDFNYQSFEIGIDSVSEMIAAANTMPFVTSTRLVVIEAIEKAKSSDLEELAKYAENPNESTIFVIVGTRLLKNTKLYKRIKEKGDILERKAPTRRELPNAVLSLFKKEGLQANIQIAEALINTVGEDLDYLTQAVSRVALYLGTRKKVELEDIASAVEDSVQVKPWEFTNALQERNKVKALQLYQASIKQGISELALLALTVKMVRELITCRALIDRGEADLLTVATKLGKQEWLARRILDHSRAFKSTELNEIFLSLAEIEEKLKSGGEKSILFAQMIVRF